MIQHSDMLGLNVLGHCVYIWARASIQTPESRILVNCSNYIPPPPPHPRCFVSTCCFGAPILVDQGEAGDILNPPITATCIYPMSSNEPSICQGVPVDDRTIVYKGKERATKHRAVYGVMNDGTASSRHTQIQRRISPSVTQFFYKTSIKGEMNTFLSAWTEQTSNATPNH